ncbi:MULTISPECIES: AI-2E family transporter [unclassified Bacillus (in: firmicutes)]|uniref:AI-2E family transporter n=1 Tax=unclassified Bacillus (in: firmicutes) TaxID=185979 RepID=UPI000B84C120|nr:MULTISPECIES: AI-2E family transporter [unclassified Bacillus (in: firmicutes)]
MDIRMKWFYMLGYLLLLFIVVFIFLKLSFFWLPIINVLLKLLTPFFIAAFITYLLHPVIERLHERGLHRGVAIFLIYSLFFGGIGFAFYKGIPVFISQIKDLSENSPAFANQYKSLLRDLQEKTEYLPIGFQNGINDGINGLEKKLENLLEAVMLGLMNLLNSALLIAIIPFIAFYMLKDFNLMKRAVWYMTPKRWRREGIHFLKDVNVSLGGYIRGQLLVCTIIGTISAISFWFIDLKYPLVLGLIIGLTDIIPYFGPILGAIPAVIIAATYSPKMILITLIIIFALQFLEGNILSPYIVGKSLHLHPLLIMFALLAGGEIGGILGMILAVPVLSVTKVAIMHAKDHFSKNKMDHPTV